MPVRSRKWGHSLGHDGLTAEHNNLVEVADALVVVLEDIERSAPLSASQRDEIRAVLANYLGPAASDVSQGS